MGSSNSKSVSTYSFGFPSNPFSIHGIYPNEKQLLDGLRSIILRDEILDRVVEQRFPNCKKSRACHDRMSKWELEHTIWGKVILSIRNEILHNGGYESDTKLQKKFRSRFRVPFSMFEHLVVECTEANVFGRTQIGVEYKLLGCLRILGRGCYADDICEILGIGNQTVSYMFKQFLENYSKAYFDKYVYVPEGADLDRVVEDYTRMGFPGCVGSMDVTHIMWKQCPSSLRHVCTGRYHCPSVAFQMVCDHTRRIHHVSRPFYGATNDITITYNDSYPRDVMLGNVHADRVFSTYDREGGLTYWSGAYLICDGGYPKCVCFVDPALTDYEYHTVVWTEWLESVRKDVERLFGALKQRFRWLSHSVEYHNINTLGFGVRVAAILHNRLLKYDNFDKLDWENMDPNGEEYFEDEEDASIAEDEASAVVEVEEEPVVEYICQELPDVQDLSAEEKNNNAEDPMFPEVLKPFSR
jgi:hypothetical protein